MSVTALEFTPNTTLQREPFRCQTCAGRVVQCAQQGQAALP